MSGTQALQPQPQKITPHSAVLESIDKAGKTQKTVSLIREQEPKLIPKLFNWIFGTKETRETAEK